MVPLRWHHYKLCLQWLLRLPHPPQPVHHLRLLRLLRLRHLLGTIHHNSRLHPLPARLLRRRVADLVRRVRRRHLRRRRGLERVPGVRCWDGVGGWGRALLAGRCGGAGRAAGPVLQRHPRRLHPLPSWFHVRRRGGRAGGVPGEFVLQCDRCVSMHVVRGRNLQGERVQRDG